MVVGNRPTKDFHPFNKFQAAMNQDMYFLTSYISTTSAMVWMQRHHPLCCFASWAILVITAHWMIDWKRLSTVLTCGARTTSGLPLLMSFQSSPLEWASHLARKMQRLETRKLYTGSSVPLNDTKLQTSPNLIIVESWGHDLGQ